MHTHSSADSTRYARCIEASKRIRWDIDRDVIRGRSFDLRQKFLPDQLSLIDELPFLSPADQRLLGQIQGRTYANMFGLVERFIGAKMLEISRDHWLGDQTALEALVRFTDEEMKHQELFRRIEALAADRMAPGYRFEATPNGVAEFVLGKSSWAVLALTCHIELFTQTHYRASIGEAGEDVSDLYRDVFLFHWKEESQHAILDELEWLREDAKLVPLERDAAVEDLIALVQGVDGILQGQAAVDTAYFLKTAGIINTQHIEQIGDTVLKAYRWQYIVSGLLEPRLQSLLNIMLSAPQLARIQQAVSPLLYAMPASGPLAQAA